MSVAFSRAPLRVAKGFNPESDDLLPTLWQSDHVSWISSSNRQAALFPPDVRKSMQDCIRQQYAEGNFRSTEDILCDESNTVRFWSYYVQKAVDPITEPMKGSHLKGKICPLQDLQLRPDAERVLRRQRIPAVRVRRPDAKQAPRRIQGSAL
jgi:hypothetical protein